MSNCIEVAANNLREPEKGLPEINNIDEFPCFLQSLDPSQDLDYFRLGSYVKPTNTNVTSLFFAQPNRLTVEQPL